MRTSPILLLATVVALGVGACAGAGEAPSPDVPTSAVAAPLPTFEPCVLTEAAHSFLQPRVLSDADLTADVEHFGSLPPGSLRVQAAGEIELVDGLLGAGNGWEASTAGVEGIAVADDTVTATINTSVFSDDEHGWPALAFLELRVGDARPETWTETDELGILTDGGDGGFVATGAVDDLFAATGTVEDLFADDGLDAATEASDRYLAALGGSDTCLLRRSADGDVDGVLFSTGGDGYFPTFLGRDASGTVVSVVWYDIAVPWAFAGLPGSPPAVFEDDPVS